MARPPDETSFFCLSFICSPGSCTTISTYDSLIQSPRVSTLPALRVFGPFYRLGSVGSNDPIHPPAATRLLSILSVPFEGIPYVSSSFSPLVMRKTCIPASTRRLCFVRQSHISVRLLAKHSLLKLLISCQVRFLLLSASLSVQKAIRTPARTTSVGRALDIDATHHAATTRQSCLSLIPHHSPLL